MRADAWRIYDLRRGIAGSGYHGFLMDEIEFGPRVAMALDEDDQAWWVLIGTPSLIALQEAEGSRLIGNPYPELWDEGVS